VYPFDENGPALAVYALLKGMLKVCRLNSEEITIELLIGISDSKYLNLDWHPLLNVPMISVLRNLKSINACILSVWVFVRVKEEVHLAQHKEARYQSATVYEGG